VQRQLTDLQQRREAHIASLSALADRFCFYNGTDTESTACQHRSQPELDSHQTSPGFGRHRRVVSGPGNSPSEALAPKSSAGGAECGVGAALAKIEKLNKQLHAVRQLALREQGRAEAVEVRMLHNSMSMSTDEIVQVLLDCYEYPVQCFLKVSEERLVCICARQGHACAFPSICSLLNVL
jgi:hypothetical protein